MMHECIIGGIRQCHTSRSPHGRPWGQHRDHRNHTSRQHKPRKDTRSTHGRPWGKHVGTHTYPLGRQSGERARLALNQSFSLCLCVAQFRSSTARGVGQCCEASHAEVSQPAVAVELRWLLGGPNHILSLQLGQILMLMPILHALGGVWQYLVVDSVIWVRI